MIIILSLVQHTGKDPKKATVDNTVDSYVYVEITDATEGLVSYAIADGWTKLDGL